MRLLECFIRSCIDDWNRAMRWAAGDDACDGMAAAIWLFFKIYILFGLFGLFIGVLVVNLHG